MQLIYNPNDPWRIDRATGKSVSAITALANRVALLNLSEEQKQRGFLLPYTAAQYSDFTRLADHFYILHVGKQFTGFVLAHSSEKIDLSDEEVYLHTKDTEANPFIVARQICVAPEFSNRGYGRKLYAFLFACAEKDIPRYQTAICFIWKHPHNQASEKFHRAVGWEEQETYILKNSDGVVGIWVHTITSS